MKKKFLTESSWRMKFFTSILEWAFSNCSRVKYARFSFNHLEGIYTQMCVREHRNSWKGSLRKPIFNWIIIIAFDLTGSSNFLVSPCRWSRMLVWKKMMTGGKLLKSLHPRLSRVIMSQHYNRFEGEGSHHPKQNKKEKGEWNRLLLLDCQTNGIQKQRLRVCSELSFIQESPKL